LFLCAFVPLCLYFSLTSEPRELSAQCFSENFHHDHESRFKSHFRLVSGSLTGDFYAAFLTPLLPLFVDKLGLTLTQVGLLAASAGSWPLWSNPRPVTLRTIITHAFSFWAGPLLATVFMPLIGVAPSYLVLILFVCMGSIGVSMFHPTAAGMVSQYAGSVSACPWPFLTLGELSPLGWVRSSSPFSFTPGDWSPPGDHGVRPCAHGFLFKIVPLRTTEGLGDLGFMGSIKEAFGAVWKPIFTIWSIRFSGPLSGRSS